MTDQSTNAVPEKIDLAEVLAARNNPPAPAPAPVEPPPVETPAPPVTPAPAPEPPADPFVTRFGRPAEEVEKELNQVQWLKEDQFINKVVSLYKGGQPLDKIINTLGKNWKDAPDADIIREVYAREGITDRELQDFKLQQQFGDYTPEDDTPEAKLARMELAKKAAEARTAFLKEQESFGQPVNHPEKMAAEIEKMVADWHSQVDAAPETKAIKETNRLALTVDGQTQNLEVDSAKLSQLVKGYGDLLSAIGDLPLSQQYQVAAFASDPEQFVRQLVELGKTMAKEAFLKEERNPAPVTPPAPPELADLAGIPPAQWTAEQKAMFARGAQRK